MGSIFGGRCIIKDREDNNCKIKFNYFLVNS